MTQPYFAISTLLVALAGGACSRSQPAGEAERKAPEASAVVSNRIAIEVTSDGFVPSHADTDAKRRRRKLEWHARLGGVEQRSPYGKRRAQRRLALQHVSAA
jgi:hypothetical protein